MTFRKNEPNSKEFSSFTFSSHHRISLGGTSSVLVFLLMNIYPVQLHFKHFYPTSQNRFYTRDLLRTTQVKDKTRDKKENITIKRVDVSSHCVSDTNDTSNLLYSALLVNRMSGCLC